MDLLKTVWILLGVVVCVVSSQEKVYATEDITEGLGANGSTALDTGAEIIHLFVHILQETRLGACWEAAV